MFMKKIINSILFVFALSSLIFLAACSAEKTDRVAVILDMGSFEFSDIGQTAPLGITVYENGVPPTEEDLQKDLKWSTTDPEVAVFNGKEITAVGFGSCVIRVRYKTGSATCTVNNPNPNPPLSISEKELTLDNIGATKKLTATSERGEDISNHVEWKSSNNHIATCEGGVVLAKGYGSCTISANSSNQTVVCSVTVNNPTAPHVSMSQNELKLNVGESYALKAIPSTNAGNLIAWKSSNPEVASCEDGAIVAKSNGACVILAISDRGYTGVTLVNVGDTSQDIEYEQYLKFDFPNVGKELKYIDNATGNLLSKAIVTSYTVTTPYLLDDGRLVVEISLECVKTYDANGLESTTPAVITTDLYSENDVWRARHQYKSSNAIVGDSFTVKCSGFTVQTLTYGGQLEFYMTFA